MTEGVFEDTVLGTAQSGITSPLLSNIALHGLEDLLDIQYNT